MNMKNVIDVTAAPVALLGNITLSHVPVIVNVVVGLMAIAWYAVRFYDRFCTTKTPEED